MTRFSANLGFLWTELPLIDRIAAAGHAGFDAVEMHWPYDTDPAAVREACARAGLVLLGINTTAGDTHAGEFGLGAVPGAEARFRADVAACLAWARAAGARAVHVLAGIVGDESRRAARRVFLDNLRFAADAARGDGIVLLLEPMNRRDRPGYLYARVEEAAEFVDAIGHDAAGIMFDTYHAGLTVPDVAAAFDAALPLVRHVQIASVPDRSEPDHGAVDHPALFALAARRGYPGFFGAEYRPRGRTEDGLGWLVMAREQA